MPEWLQGNEWAAWLALALVLGVIEAATVDLVFVMLAGGALAASITAFAGGPLIAQVLVGLAVAAALLGVVRPAAKKRLDRHDDGPIGTARHIGSDATVTETVTGDAGRVRVGGDVWSARLEPGHPIAAVGTTVRVVEIRGATLVVTPAQPVRDVITRGE